MERRCRSTSARRICFRGSDPDEDGNATSNPTTDLRITYLLYERLNRAYPYWPLSDLKGMTPRQRRYWLAMGELRMKIKKTIMEKGQVPLDG